MKYERLNMELDMQSLFGLHVHSYIYWLRPGNPTPPFSRIWAHMRGLNSISQPRKTTSLCNPPRPSIDLATHPSNKYTSIWPC